MATLYYVHDPMCSWCYGFSRVLQELLDGLPPDVTVIRLLGGLAVDCDTPMPEEMRQHISGNWRRIEATIPGVKFNFDFWTKNTPRRSTYPACRAVIAARQQGAEYDVAMTRAIQRAYYREARNPSDESTLIALAGELGLDVEAFTRELRAPHTRDRLLDEIRQARSMGANSFPSLVLEHQGRYTMIPIDYNNSQAMLAAIG